MPNKSYKEKGEKDSLQKLIEESGHNLHLEVVDILENKGWEVEISPYYYDEVIDKPREVDIIASREILVTHCRKAIDKYKIYLFIECKYLVQEVIFWMLNTNSQKISEAIKGTLSINISPDQIEEHHYKVSQIAKLYYTRQKEKGQDIIFQSFINVIHSLIFFKKEKPEKAIYYPIVVYKGKEKVALVSRKNNKTYKFFKDLENRNILLEVNYLYKSFGGDRPDFDKRPSNIMRQTFFVDFIEKDKLNKFLDEIIEKEKDEFSKILFFKKLAERRVEK